MYRDELAAAQARIAVLEEKLRRESKPSAIVETLESERAAVVERREAARRRRVRTGWIAAASSIPGFLVLLAPHIGVDVKWLVWLFPMVLLAPFALLYVPRSSTERVCEGELAEIERRVADARRGTNARIRTDATPVDDGAVAAAFVEIVDDSQRGHGA